MDYVLDQIDPRFDVSVSSDTMCLFAGKVAGRSAFRRKRRSTLADSPRRDRPLKEGPQPGIRILREHMDFPGETTNEHFIIWMRAAAMPTFVKLFAKCDHCLLEPGDYKVEIMMTFPQSVLPGRRWVILTTLSSLGTPSTFVVLAYCVPGAVILGVACLFVCQTLVGPRKRRGIPSLVQTTRMLAGGRADWDVLVALD
jgi:hypothetical protein